MGGTQMANNGHGLGFEQKLWIAADKMRNNMEWDCFLCSGVSEDVAVFLFEIGCGTK